MKSFFLYKNMYKASCWDCDDFYVGNAKRRLFLKFSISTGHDPIYIHCVIKNTFTFALNENVDSEKRFLYKLGFYLISQVS